MENPFSNTSCDATAYYEVERRLLSALIENNIKSLCEPQQYKTYLCIMATFPMYSSHNALLIYLQNPKATIVTTKELWEANNRQVLLRSKEIKMLMPMPYFKSVTKYWDENGQAIKNPVTKTIQLIRLLPTMMYDISQTQGRNLKKQYMIMPAEHRDEAIKVIHERAYAGAGTTIPEFQAASVEYVSCRRLNLSCENYSFAEIRDFSQGKTTTELLQLFKEIKQSAGKIIAELEPKMERIQAPSLMQQQDVQWKKLTPAIQKKCRPSIADRLEEAKKTCAERAAAAPPRAPRKSKDHNMSR